MNTRSSIIIIVMLLICSTATVAATLKEYNADPNSACGSHSQPQCAGNLCDPGLQACDAGPGAGYCHWCCDDYTSTCGNPPIEQPRCQNDDPTGVYYDPDCTDAEVCVNNGDFWLEEDSWLDPAPSDYQTCCEYSNDCVAHSGDGIGCNPHSSIFDWTPGESSLCADNTISACTGLHVPGVNDATTGDVIAGACCSGPYNNLWTSDNRWTTSPLPENTWTDSCADSADNDCDGLVDCADSDCASSCNHDEDQGLCVADGFYWLGTFSFDPSTTAKCCENDNGEEMRYYISDDGLGYPHTEYPTWRSCCNSPDDCGSWDSAGCHDYGDTPIIDMGGPDQGTSYPDRICGDSNTIYICTANSACNFQAGARCYQLSSSAFVWQATPPAENCGDGIDNDCDQLTDSDDPNCDGVCFPYYTSFDYNNDDALDGTDIEILSQVIYSGYPCPGGKVCDVNGDEAVNAADIERLNQIIIGTYDNDEACDDGIDNNCDGLFDDQDPACWECQNNEDCDPVWCPSLNNTINGACEGHSCHYEEPPFTCITACSDGVDNDQDGMTDYPMDQCCQNFADTSEACACVSDADCISVCPDNWPLQGQCINNNCYFEEENCLCHPYYYYYDYNNDGLLNSSDVSILITVVIGGSCPIGTICDVNEDDDVNAADVELLMEIIAGTVPIGEICDDEIDNDCDAMIDDADTDCAQTDCEDSDGGLDYYERGTVIRNPPTHERVYTDTCILVDNGTLPYTPLPRFEDVPLTHYAEPWITLARGLGITVGYNEHQFGPEDPVTRGQTAAFLYHALQIPENTTGGPHFADVPTTHMFYKEIESVYHQDWMVGYGGGLFGPEDHITRELFVTVIVRILGLDTQNVSMTPYFIDVPVTHPHFRDIQAAYEAGLIAGYGNGLFGPDDNTTRAQVIVIIMGAISERVDSCNADDPACRLMEFSCNDPSERLYDCPNGCNQGVCVPVPLQQCGDGTIQAGETCDDGATITFDFVPDITAPMQIIRHITSSDTEPYLYHGMMTYAGGIYNLDVNLHLKVLTVSAPDGEFIVILQQSNYRTWTGQFMQAGQQVSVIFVTQIWGPIDGCPDFDDFTGGTLSCTDHCFFNTSLCTGGVQGICGDGVVNPGEECDGNPEYQDIWDWGNITGCWNFDSFTGGALRCDSDCLFDTSDCTADEEVWCSDSDGGIAPPVFGIVTLSNGTTPGQIIGTYPDMCIDSYTLNEMFCRRSTTSCIWENHEYLSGDSWPSGDGCNLCSCSNGMVHCTDRACGPDIDYPACSYHDDCNVCVCTSHGATCTDRACAQQFPAQLGTIPIACDGLCIDGKCVGIAPICGDGVISPGEQCDFAEDGLEIPATLPEGGSANYTLYGILHQVRVVEISSTLDDFAVKFNINGEETPFLRIGQSFNLSTGARLFVSIITSDEVEFGLTMNQPLFSDLDCTDFDEFTGGVLSCNAQTCLANVDQCTGGTLGFCGDSIVNQGEQCDGTNFSDLDCTDFDNFIGGNLSCTETCLANTGLCIPLSGICGDGALDPGEQCDDGNENIYDNCGLLCTTCVYAICPPGTFGYEAGDTNGDGCGEYLCVPNTVCGDGVIQPGEQCDRSNWGPITGCSDFDNYTGGELICSENCLFDVDQCTGGNQSGFCGDGVINNFEQCDGSNWGPISDCTDFDSFTGGALSCSAATCMFDTTLCTMPPTPYCGDGVIQPGEQCDSSNWGPITGCSDFDSFTGGILECEMTTCIFDTSQCVGPLPVCGDSIIQPGEECDGSNWGPITGCTGLDNFTGGSLSCNPNACLFDTTLCTGSIDGICGDGVIQVGETCDGNPINESNPETENEWDWGPIADCTDLDSFTGGQLSCGTNCHFDTSMCIMPEPICGDTIISPGEECDGSNWGPITDCTNFDSFTGGTLICDATTCEFDTSQCNWPGPVCGNNIIENGEQCDGGNLGGHTCGEYGYNRGSPSCTPICTISVSGCYNSGGGGGGGGGGSGTCANGYVRVNGTCVKQNATTAGDGSSTTICDADKDGYVKYSAACAGKGLGTDCDDTDDQIHPGASELCDGVDNDCDGSVDEGCEPQKLLSYNSQIRAPLLSIITYEAVIGNTGDVPLEQATLSLELPTTWEYDGEQSLGTLRSGESRRVTFRILISEELDPTQQFTIRLGDRNGLVATGDVQVAVEIPEFAVRIKPSLSGYANQPDGEVFVLLNNKKGEPMNDLEVEMDINRGATTDYVQYLGVFGVKPYSTFRYRYTYPVARLQQAGVDAEGYLRQRGSLIETSDDTIDSVYHPTAFEKDARSLEHTRVYN